MKSQTSTVLLAALLSLFLVVSTSPARAVAAGDNSAAAPTSRQQSSRKQFLSKFDANKDGKISTKERAAARQVVAGKRQQRALDRNAEALK